MGVFFPRRRQPPRLACRSLTMRFAVLFATFAVATPAAAEDGLEIVFAMSSSAAPAMVTATASAADAEPFLAYRWGPMAQHPRCKGRACAVQVSVASCRKVTLEATTLLGATKTAAETLCVPGPAGRAPKAWADVDRSVSPVTVRARFDAGSDPIVRRWVWLDDTAQPAEMQFSLPEDGGCHSIDVVAVDSAGRLGIDHRDVCLSDEAPVVWLGSSAGTCVTVGDAHQVCSEVDHPLGASMQTDGDVPADGCVSGGRPTGGLTRRVVRARDDRGVLSVGSVVTCVAPADGAPTLFFADAPAEATASVGAPLEVDVTLFGGEAPFTVDATLAPGDRRTAQRARGEPEAGRMRLVIDEVRNGADVRTLEVRIQDRHGLEITASVQVAVSGNTAQPSMPAAGFQSSSAAGCSATGADPSMTALLLLGLLGLTRRRR